MENDTDRPVTKAYRLSLTPGLLYLGIGFLFHAMAIGPGIDFGDAWSYVYVLLWPPVLLLVFLKEILTVAAGLALVGFLVFAAATGTEQWERRRARRPGALPRHD